MENPTINETDVRAMVRLLGDVIAAPGDINVKRRLLMDGLCQMINADVWVWCMAEFDPDKPPSFIGLLHSGFDEERFANYLLAMNHPAMEPVTRPSSLELKSKGIHLTRTQRQMDPDFLLEKSPAAPVWEKAGIGALMTSQRPMLGGGISGIGVYRDLGRPISTSARPRSPTSFSARSRGCISPPIRIRPARTSPAFIHATARFSIFSETAGPARRSPPTSASARTPSTAT